MQRKPDRSARTLNVRNKITLSAILLLGAMLIITALLASGLRTLSNALRWSEQAWEAKARLNTLDRLIGELGAALHAGAGEAQLPALLTRFSAKDGITAEVERIGELIGNDSAQAARLEQLRRRTDVGQWHRLLASGGGASVKEIRAALEDAHTSVQQISGAHTLAMARRRAETESLSTKLIINAAILCLLVIAITVIASRRLARRIIDPINQMMLAAERLMLGDLAPRVEERTGDEIGQLARAFNRMAERIAEREKAILARNQELDELRDFNALLQTSDSEEEIHRALLQKVRALDLTQAVILNRRSEDNTLAVAASLDSLAVSSEDYLAARPGCGESAASEQADEIRQIPVCRVVRAGREMVIQDVKDDLLCADCRFGQRRGSAFCVPIMAGGKTIGALHLASPKTDYWNTDRQRLARMLVDQAAPAINNLRSMKTLEDRTLMDEHTRVCNRHYLDEYLKQQIALARRQGFPVSVMMLDIDHFKRLNDRYGHEAGDIVLRQFAATIKDSLREGEIVARYGGEEFTVVMNGTAKAAQTLAERLRRAVAALSFPQFAQHGEEVRVTMSIGIAEFPNNGQTVEDVVKSADFALYRAKDGGRNCVKLASRSLMAIKGAQNRL
ncbi:MAG TPA: diguanylate cyclase [Blastocatellia bacterium]|nr:diguanylate cyclase [Blastocatellia bacterium]